MHPIRSFPFALALILSISLHAQTPSSFLQEAMKRTGNWAALRNFHYQSRSLGVNPWQSYSFTDPKEHPTDLEYHMDFEQNRYRNSFRVSYPGGYVFHFLHLGRDSARYLYDLLRSRNGSVMLKSGKEGFLAGRAASTQNLPYYILQSALSSGDSLLLPSASTVRRVGKNGSVLDLIFDPSQRLVRTVRFAGRDTIERYFEDWKMIGGLELPMRIRQAINGKTTATETVRTFRHDVPFDAQLFDPLPGYTEQKPAPPKPLEAKAVAKDVYLIEGVAGDRNVLFVNMKDYVVVTDAPVSPDVTRQVLEQIRKTLPGKRIGYVHLSHHHNDHLTGVRQWVAEGAVLLSAAPIEAPVRAILSGALGPYNDDYAKAPREPRFERFGGVRVLDDGEHRVEFHAPKNTHAEGLSFLYLPREGLIYQGDFLTVPEDGTLTPAIEVSHAFHRYLRAKRIRYRRIIGHHGHAHIEPAMFEKMLRLK